MRSFILNCSLVSLIFAISFNSSYDNEETRQTGGGWNPTTWDFSWIKNLSNNKEPIGAAAVSITPNQPVSNSGVVTSQPTDTIHGNAIAGGKSFKNTLASIPAVLLYANPFYKHKSRRHRKRGHGTKKRKHHK